VSGAGVHTLAEIWNGRRWTLTPTPPPNPQELSSLTSVSCDAPGSCTAVGGLLKTKEGSQPQPFALRWDGTRWTSQAVPIPPEGEQGSGLQGVSCTSASACTAVGIYYYNDIDQGVFSVRFDGSAWSLQRQPNPKGENLNAEYAVSCAAATSCMAVGSWLTRLELEVHTLAEVWNGSTWARLSTPRPPHAVGAVLNGVSCVSATACAAAGESSSNSETTPTVTLIEEWNGAGWALRPSPKTAGAQSARLAGLSCQASGCVAVGSVSTPSVTQTLVERNGP
jgi:hypothetical protein